MTETAAAGGATAGTDAQHIIIMVKEQDGTEIYFKIKRSIQLKKLMDAYCNKQGLCTNWCRFMFDGECLKEDDTPDKLELENGDKIDVIVEQTGGDPAPGGPSAGTDAQHITIKVKGQDGTEMYFKIKRSTQLK